jgi:hypothetical protein
MLHLSEPTLRIMRPAFYCSAILLLHYLLLSITVQSQVQNLYLDPKTVAREKQTKFVDSIRFIPLEVKEGIEVGAYYNVNLTDKYILLNDYRNKRVLVYANDGKFVKNIDYKKLGEGFYPSFEALTNQVTLFGNNKNYSLTARDQVMIKLDWNNPRNRKYFRKYTIDLNDTSLALKKDIPNEKDIIKVFHLYDDYYMQGQITVSPLYKDSVDHELKLYKGKQLVKTFFPYNRTNEPRFLFNPENVGSDKTDSPKTYIITRPFCDTIYKLIEDSLFAAYRLVLPLENSLPASFFTRRFKNKTEYENFHQNNGWMFRQLYGFYETPRFIFMMVRYFRNAESYIFEKQTAVTYKTKNIRSDSSHFNLQLLADFGSLRKGDKWYKPQRAADILTFFEQHKDIAVPKELESFLNSKPPAASPVIVEFKFKN